MNVLITGAAGNLGSFLAQHLLNSRHNLRLLIHRKPLPFDVSLFRNVTVYPVDLEKQETLHEPCLDTHCIVHFAGVLFAPRPQKFMQKTNVEYVKNLVDAALEAGVERFILISFPHVEGESSPENPAKGLLDGNPSSVHAKTRLQAEKYLFQASEGRKMIPVSLRSGLIYGRGVLMIEAARWLLKYHLLGVWRQPTWTHVLALPDFLSCVEAAIDRPGISGIYNIGDDNSITLQGFLDTVAIHWGFKKPWRVPNCLFYLAAWCCELFGIIFGKGSPLTRDFIKIGMASYYSDTSRMKKELLPKLSCPSLKEGMTLL
jgi:nucleoside-diphosphate-sugar epimerase